MKLSNSYRLTIAPRPSGSYLLFICLTYIFTLTMLLTATITIWTKIILVVFIIINVLREPFPLSPCPGVEVFGYDEQGWWLRLGNEDIRRYDTLMLLAFTGLFSLLEFQAEDKSKKKVLIFRDQCSAEQYRLLNLLIKIT